MTLADLKARLENQGYELSISSLCSIRSGDKRPTYRMVDIAASQLFKDSIDPKIEDEASFRRRFFDSANYVEVTPESIEQHNAKVIETTKNAIAGGKKILWGKLLREILDFQIQGDRISISGLARKMRQQTEGRFFTTDKRLHSVLSGDHISTPEERELIYENLHLSDDHKKWINDSLQNGTISCEIARVEKNSFYTALAKIITRLSQQKIYASDIAESAMSKAATRLAASHGIISKDDIHDRLQRIVQQISLEKMRLLLIGLDGFATAEEIKELTTTAGYDEKRLWQTAKQVASDIGDTESIKTILRRLREATDTNISQREWAEMPGISDNITISRAQVFNWELATSPYPESAQVKELLKRLNNRLRDNHSEALSDDDISRITKIADRDKIEWVNLSHKDKHRHRTGAGNPLARH